MAYKILKEWGIMGFYIPERKAMYLSPNRLEALHRRKGLSDETDENCVICRLARGKMTWLDFAGCGNEGSGSKKCVRTSSRWQRPGFRIRGTADSSRAVSFIGCSTSSKHSTIDFAPHCQQGPEPPDPNSTTALVVKGARCGPAGLPSTLTTLR
jgi:hypothetical protein